eukprot:GHVQ01025176.1.p1 GENE.GHVQ01025176.1~~GHVQ01025176.1.p1  ORF type:complete len:509 (+),score=53.98 GHVQ01025176.1:1434-2960(+)
MGTYMYIFMCGYIYIYVLYVCVGVHLIVIAGTAVTLIFCHWCCDYDRLANILQDSESVSRSSRLPEDMLNKFKTFKWTSEAEANKELGYAHGKSTLAADNAQSAEHNTTNGCTQVHKQVTHTEDTHEQEQQYTESGERVSSKTFKDNNMMTMNKTSSPTGGLDGLPVDGSGSTVIMNCTSSDTLSTGAADNSIGKDPLLTRSIDVTSATNTDRVMPHTASYHPLLPSNYALSEVIGRSISLNESSSILMSTVPSWNSQVPTSQSTPGTPLSSCSLSSGHFLAPRNHSCSSPAPTVTSGYQHTTAAFPPIIPANQIQLMQCLVQSPNSILSSVSPATKNSIPLRLPFVSRTVPLQPLCVDHSIDITGEMYGSDDTVSLESVSTRSHNDDSLLFSVARTPLTTPRTCSTTSSRGSVDHTVHYDRACDEQTCSEKCLSDEVREDIWTDEGSSINTSCAICLCSYRRNEVIRLLPCRHFFHRRCIDRWFSSNNTCPMRCNIAEIMKQLEEAI